MSQVASESESSNSLYYPPGGILVWLIVFVEIITFCMGLVAFNIYRADEPAVFAESQALLNRGIGLVNTLVLLTSGFFMALAVHHLKKGKSNLSAKMIAVTIFFGLLFLALKGFEYSEKMELGIGIEYNSFFMFYWLLTGFHFIHVLLGVAILVYMFFKTKSGEYNA
ncbi:MAG: cytochrome c oxidase subunit 3, partial [Flavobacteriales bacterium]